MQLLDLPDDILRLITRLCGTSDCRPVLLYHTCRRLGTIGYGGIDALVVMAEDRQFVTSSEDRGVTALPVVPVAKTRKLPLRYVRGCLRSARSLRHRTLLDRSHALTHGGWGWVPCLEHPLFLRLAPLLDGLPLASLHCSGGAVHMLAGRAGVGAASLRQLALTDLSARDDAQQAVVRALLGAHGQTLTALRLDNVRDDLPRKYRPLLAARPLACLAAAAAMPALQRLTLACHVGRAVAAVIAEQCPVLEALCLTSGTHGLADGVGAAWAGGHVLPRLTCPSWSASPADAAFDAAAELATLVRGRRLTSLRLDPQDQEMVATVGFGVPFVRRVIKAMPVLPAHCELLVGQWDESHLRALVDTTTGEVGAVESLHLSLCRRSASTLEPLGRLPSLRELHILSGPLPHAPSWSALPCLEVLHMGFCADNAAALVAALAASPVRATLTTLTLLNCRIALTREQSGADLLRLTARRVLECTFLYSADFGGTMGPPDSPAEHRARRRLPTWAMRTLPEVVLRMHRFVLSG